MMQTQRAIHMVAPVLCRNAP